MSHKANIKKLMSGSRYKVSCDGSGICVYKIGDTFDIYEWSPNQAEFKIGSYFSWEIDDVVKEIESWERF